jgi:hypothetical protein
MDNPLNGIVKDLIESNTGVLVESALNKIPEVRDLLQGKPVELVITLQLRPKA